MHDGVSYQNDLGQIAVCWSSGLLDADSGLARLEWRLWKELNGTWAYVQQGHLVVGDPRLTTALSSRILTLFSVEPAVKSGSSLVAQPTSPAASDTWGLDCCTRKRRGHENCHATRLSLCGQRMSTTTYNPHYD